MSGRSPFGDRHPALFASDDARAAVAAVVDTIAAAVTGDLDDEDVRSDLCRESAAMGPLAALPVLAPAEVPRATLETWRKRAAEGLATIEANDDEEVDFHREYHTNLDGLLAALLARSA